jgi:chromosome segregation protein
MPYLKKIELRGFKTFGQATSILLEKGFTAITGPNGSGKTNVIDAVLFGLGELSSRRLRADNFAKLIFHGSPEAGVEKAKAAKVVMQFDNSDGRLPVDTTTVTISREVYRNGQSVYRLNGRRMSRANIVDTLAMAGISSAGHNVVLQGTITRMAEIAPFERRKILDDMVGIAQYDAEKAEAEEKLRMAEIQIKTAMGRIDEVQKRVDDLERERNQLLRFNFIQTEIKRFEAIRISHDLGETQTKITDLSSEIEEATGRVEKLRQLRDEQRGERHQVEKEWRKLSSEEVEKGGTRVLEVQIKIGEIKSRLTELTTKIGASTASLEGLRKVRENSLQQLEAIKNDIAANRKNLGQFKRDHNRLAKEIAEKQTRHDALANETTQLWANLGDNSKRIREIEQRLDRLYQNSMALRSDFAQSQTNLKMFSRRLEDLTARKQRFASSLDELNKSVTDLTEVQKEQKTRLKTLQQTLERRIAQKDAVENEIASAGKIADSAREAVVEFATQRELAETVASEEMALRSIEEMGELGVIPGVLGRFRNLVKTEKGYRSAVEAAAAGWLDSIVVKDFEAAFTCSETLRRLKLGRIKIIPLREVMNAKHVRQPRIDGVSGAASQLVKFSKQYEPAVAFVFGDTLLAKDDKAALTACKEGFRTVTVEGDLYEAGGAIESGFYRAPIDFSALIPRENAVKSLEEAVRTLREHLTRRSTDITGLEEEINKTREEIARLTEATVTLEGEISRLRRSAKVTSRNTRRIEWNVKAVQERVEKEKTQTGVQKAQRTALLKEMQRLRGELAGLRRKVDPSHIQELEVERGKLGDELVELGQRQSGVETELATAEAKLGNVLNIGYDSVQIQLRKVEHQLGKLEDEMKGAIQEKIVLESELKKEESAKEELTQSVLTAREESKKFTDQIDDIDKQLQRLDTEYERADRLLNQLQLSHQTLQMQFDTYKARLREFGYDEPLIVTLEQFEVSESSLKLMRFELERLGAINQLALAHYDEQISRYRELSVRMNELEKEKTSIIAFMDEIELKKRKVFMEAFDKINGDFSQYFLKLTGGGEASLKLDNPEEPFSGGMDMIVQYPGKPPILVSGASSGERSVAAVAFLFAIQDFMPTSFYLFDEIDAHLDVFHVAKLSELLVEQSKKSQFVIITLKAEMADKAERVYGVYEHKGVSHIVSPTFRKEGKEVAA